MDLSSLKDTVSNLTLYDLKAGVRKVQNGLCATFVTVKPGAEIMDSCDELHGDGGQGSRGDQQRTVSSIAVPTNLADLGCSWGASSTLMQDIANGTFN
jgi:epsin